MAETVSNQTIVPSLDPVLLESIRSTYDPFPSPRQDLMLLKKTELPSAPVDTLGKPSPIGALATLRDLIGRAPSSVRNAQLSQFQPLPNMPRLNRYLRLTTIFIARNWYWLRWFLIVGIGSFIVFCLVPAIFI